MRHRPLLLATTRRRLTALWCLMGVHYLIGDVTRVTTMLHLYEVDPPNLGPTRVGMLQ